MSVLHDNRYTCDQYPDCESVTWHSSHLSILARYTRSRYSINIFLHVRNVFSWSADYIFSVALCFAGWPDYLGLNPSRLHRPRPCAFATKVVLTKIGRRVHKYESIDGFTNQMGGLTVTGPGTLMDTLTIPGVYTLRPVRQSAATVLGYLNVVPVGSLYGPAQRRRT